jgi:hypothetical protein
MEKRFSFLLLLILSSALCHSQQVVKDYSIMQLDSSQFILLQSKYGGNKQLPPDFEKQTLLALSHFEELKRIKIKFKVKRKLVPLATHPTVFTSFFKPEKRRYKITISKKSIKMLSPILLKNLNYNAQIGVLGHELSHVADFNSKSFGGILKILFGNFSSSFLDRFEYNTDKICIEHGLGYQLLAWSKNVNDSLHLHSSDKATKEQNTAKKKERYMRPSTIERILSQDPAYAN